MWASADRDPYTDVHEFVEKALHIDIATDVLSAMISALISV